MGLSSSKSKSTTKPVYEQEIKGAADFSRGVAQDNQGRNQDLSNQIGGLVPGLIDKYNQGNPALNAATSYTSDVLGGKYLTGNPYLEDMISTTRGNVTDELLASLGTRGQFGGSAHTNKLSEKLAESELGLRYGDYNAERGRQGQAAGLAPSLAAADYAAISPALAAAGASAELPWVGANNYARNTAGLLGSYTNQTQKTTPPWGPVLGSLIGSGLTAFAGGGG